MIKYYETYGNGDNKNSILSTHLGRSHFSLRSFSILYVKVFTKSSFVVAYILLNRVLSYILLNLVLGQPIYSYYVKFGVQPYWQAILGQYWTNIARNIGTISPKLANLRQYTEYWSNIDPISFVIRGGAL